MTTREVILDGGSPWGFRMHGGADVHQPLRISRVNPGSKASLKGIREGDLITSINCQSTKELTNSEAHSLLKSAGDKLKLGLNEEGGGSPKRRQYKTVLQETHSETIRKSSTTYTVSTTNESDSIDISPTNETRTNGSMEKRGSADSRENGVISQRSTLSSNESTPSSSDLKGADAMADNGNSRSKRRRNRKKKSRKEEAKNEDDPVKIIKEELEENYRVESPVTQTKGSVVKSRSLDDDEMVKITELSGSEGEDRSECNAIITEADSIEWEVTDDLSSSISPQQDLRDFHLVTASQVCIRSSPEKSKKARKREQIAQYFMTYQHQYFLDAISEEGSDLSDREHKTSVETCTSHYLPKLELTRSPNVQQGRLKEKSSRAKIVEVCTKYLPELETVQPPLASLENYKIGLPKDFGQQASTSQASKTSKAKEEFLATPPKSDTSTHSKFQESPNIKSQSPSPKLEASISLRSEASEEISESSISQAEVSVLKKSGASSVQKSAPLPKSYASVLQKSAATSESPISEPSTSQKLETTTLQKSEVSNLQKSSTSNPSIQKSGASNLASTSRLSTSQDSVDSESSTSNPSTSQKSETITLQKSEAPTLQKSEASTLQKSEASILQKSEASTLQKSEASTLQKSEVSTLQKSEASILQKSEASVSLPSTSQKSETSTLQILEASSLDASNLHKSEASISTPATQSLQGSTQEMPRTSTRQNSEGSTLEKSEACTVERASSVQKSSTSQSEFSTSQSTTSDPPTSQLPISQKSEVSTKQNSEVPALQYGEALQNAAQQTSKDTTLKKSEGSTQQERPILQESQDDILQKSQDYIVQKSQDHNQQKSQDAALQKSQSETSTSKNSVLQELSQSSTLQKSQDSTLLKSGSSTSEKCETTSLKEVSQNSTSLKSRDSTSLKSRDSTSLKSRDSTSLKSRDSTSLKSRDSTSLKSEPSASQNCETAKASTLQEVSRKSSQCEVKTYSRQRPLNLGRQSEETPKSDLGKTSSSCRSEINITKTQEEEFCPEGKSKLLSLIKSEAGLLQESQNPELENELGTKLSSMTTIEIKSISKTQKGLVPSNTAKLVNHGCKQQSPITTSLPQISHGSKQQSSISTSFPQSSKAFEIQETSQDKPSTEGVASIASKLKNTQESSVYKKLEILKNPIVQEGICSFETIKSNSPEIVLLESASTTESEADEPELEGEEIEDLEEDGKSDEDSKELEEGRKSYTKVEEEFEELEVSQLEVGTKSVVEPEEEIKEIEEDKKSNLKAEEEIEELEEDQKSELKAEEEIGRLGENMKSDVKANEETKDDKKSYLKAGELKEFEEDNKSVLQAEKEIKEIEEEEKFDLKAEEDIKEIEEVKKSYLKAQDETKRLEENKNAEEEIKEALSKVAYNRDDDKNFEEYKKFEAYREDKKIEANKAVEAAKIVEEIKQTEGETSWLTPPPTPDSEVEASGLTELTSMLISAIKNENLELEDSKIREVSLRISEDSSKIRKDSSNMIEDSLKVCEDLSKIREDSSKIRKESSKISEDKSKITEDSSKISEGSSKIREESTNISEDTLNIREDSSKMREEINCEGTSKIREDSSKIREESTKICEDASKINEASTKIREDSSKIEEDSSKIIASKIREGSSKIGEDSSKITEDSSKIREDSSKMREETKNSEGTSKIREDSSKIREESTKICEDVVKISEASSKIREESTKICEDVVKISEASSKIKEESTKICEDASKISEASSKIREDSSKIGEDSSKIIVSSKKIVDSPIKNHSLKNEDKSLQDSLIRIEDVKEKSFRKEDKNLESFVKEESFKNVNKNEDSLKLGQNVSNRSENTKSFTKKGSFKNFNKKNEDLFKFGGNVSNTSEYSSRISEDKSSEYSSEAKIEDTNRRSEDSLKTNESSMKISKDSVKSNDSFKNVEFTFKKNKDPFEKYEDLIRTSDESKYSEDSSRSIEDSSKPRDVPIKICKEKFEDLIRRSDESKFSEDSSRIIKDSSRTRDVPIKICKESLKSTEDVMKNIKITSKTRNVPIKICKDTFRRSEEEIKDTENSAKSSENAIKIRNDATKSNEHTIKSSEDAIKSSKDTIKNSEDTIRSSEDTIKISKDTIKSSEDTIKSSEDTIKSSEDTIKISEDTIRSSEDTINNNESSTKRHAIFKMNEDSFKKEASVKDIEFTFRKNEDPFEKYQDTFKKECKATNEDSKRLESNASAKTNEDSNKIATISKKDLFEKNEESFNNMEALFKQKEDAFKLKEEHTADLFKHTEDSFKHTEDSFKHEENSFKHAEDSFKHEEDSFKLTEDSFKLTENLFKHAEDSFKHAEDSFKHAEDSFKLTEDSFKQKEEQFKEKEDEFRRKLENNSSKKGKGAYKKEELFKKHKDSKKNEESIKKTANLFIQEKKSSAKNEREELPGKNESSYGKKSFAKNEREELLGKNGSSIAQICAKNEREELLGKGESSIAQTCAENEREELFGRNESIKKNETIINKESFKRAQETHQKKDANSLKMNEDSFKTYEDSFKTYEDFFMKNEESFKKNEESFKKNEGSFKKNDESFKKNEESSKKNEESFKKNEDSFKNNKESSKNKESFKKNEASFKKNEESSKKNEESSKKNEESFKKNEESSKNEDSFRKNEESSKKNGKSSKKNEESFKKNEESSKKNEESSKKNEESSKKNQESFKKNGESFKKNDASFKKGEDSFIKTEDSYEKNEDSFKTSVCSDIKKYDDLLRAQKSENESFFAKEVEDSFNRDFSNINDLTNVIIAAVNNEASFKKEASTKISKNSLKKQEVRENNEASYKQEASTMRDSLKKNDEVSTTKSSLKKHEAKKNNEASFKQEASTMRDLLKENDEASTTKFPLKKQEAKKNNEASFKQEASTMKDSLKKNYEVSTSKISKDSMKKHEVKKNIEASFKQEASTMMDLLKENDEVSTTKFSLKKHEAKKNKEASTMKDSLKKTYEVSTSKISKDPLKKHEVEENDEASLKQEASTMKDSLKENYEVSTSKSSKDPLKVKKNNEASFKQGASTSLKKIDEVSTTKFSKDSSAKHEVKKNNEASTKITKDSLKKTDEGLTSKISLKKHEVSRTNNEDSFNLQGEENKESLRKNEKESLINNEDSLKAKEASLKKTAEALMKYEESLRKYEDSLKIKDDCSEKKSDALFKEASSSKDLYKKKTDDLLGNSFNKTGEALKKKNEVENEDSFKKEFKDVLQEELKLNTSRSGSISSESSSTSVGTTQVTVRRNMISSIGNVEDLLKDVENLQDTSKCFQPSNLKELCLQTLISLPFGADVLEELAEVSQSLEEFTNKLPKSQFHMPNNRVNLLPAGTKWVGLPTADPKTLVCLSPAQRRFLDGQRPSANEADRLLELHEKFLNRSSCHGDGSRLRPIVEGEGKVEDKVELDSRLKARDLSEWLVLARGKNSTEQFRNRRRSLPHELYVRQMQYLIEKEKEIQGELEKLEEEKRELMHAKDFEPGEYRISKNGDIAEHKARSQPSDFRQEMYEEYMRQVAAREERKQQKVIKISMNPEDTIEAKNEAPQKNDIENEFMSKVKQRMDKFGLKDDDTFEKSEPEDEEDVLIMDGDAKTITKTTKLPKHLQEFVDITHQPPEDGVWSPGQTQSHQEIQREISQDSKDDPSIAPVWTPRSAGSSPTAERKEFRPVNFESPVLSRKARTKSDGSATIIQAEPPWRIAPSGGGETRSIEKRLPTSYSAPGPGFSDATSRLPKAQNPTITLLQKAREGQIPKGAAYIEQERARRKNDSPYLSSSDLVYQIRTESMSDSDSERPRKIATASPKKYDGIGPTTKDGMPLILRSEVRDANMSQWYKKMYETIHKQKPTRYDDGRYPYTTGYLSEPEPGAYDSDATLSDSKYATLDRRRLTTTSANRTNEYQMSSTLPRNAMSTISYKPDVQHSTEIYKNQPGRIENYTPGQSSISEKEAKKWWDEVMDIFDGWLDDHSALPSYNLLLNKAIVRSHLEQQKRVPHTKGYMSQALKESGYESDSTLVFRRRDDTALQFNPLEQREVYKNIQKGGDVPLHGLRKPAPERPKELIDYYPPRSDILCYPLTIPEPQVFGVYKRTAPSTRPPSPPRRKSSRNNSTLRLISNIKSKTPKRHETCFSDSNVKFLRERISSKLTPPGTRKFVKSPPPAAPRTTRRCCNKQSKPCRSCSLSLPRKIEKVKERPASTERTFGIAKRTIDSVKLDSKIKPRETIKSKDLIKQRDLIKSKELSKSKELIKTIKPNKTLDAIKGTKIQKAPLLSVPKISSIPSIQKIEISTVSSPKRVTTKSPRSKSALSPVPSTISEKSKSSKSTSMDSLKSIKIPKQTKIAKTITPKDKKLKKSKKDQLNDEIVRSRKIKDVKVKDSKSRKKEETKQKEIIESDSFFQHLFLRDLPSPTLSCTSKGSWIYEKTRALQNRMSAYSEPTVGPLEVYLNHTKPVSESKFKSFDAMLRSRSASPKSVSWKTQNIESKERSVSLPPKLVFSQTSRPVIETSRSHGLEYKRFESSQVFDTARSHVKPMIERKKLVIHPRTKEELSKVILGQIRKGPDEQYFQKQIKKPKAPDSYFLEKSSFAAKRRSATHATETPEKMYFSETCRSISPLPETGQKIQASASSLEKLYFSEDRRSPSRERKALSQRDKLKRAPSTEKMYFSETARSISPFPERKQKVSARREAPSPDRFYFSETNRPVSPVVELKKRELKETKSTNPERFYFSETSRSISPVAGGKRLSVFSPLPERKQKSGGEASPDRLYFSETNRPVSPTIEKMKAQSEIKRPKATSPEFKISRDSARSGSSEFKKDFGLQESVFSPQSPKVLRSPSCRKIKSRQSSDKKRAFLEQSRSTSSLDCGFERSYERFKDLNRFYSTLERMGELERTTSSSDLRPRKKAEEEIIDYDRWVEVRTRERAERELDELYRQLDEEQREKDFLFRAKDVKKWKQGADRGLRIKEKSVENIRGEFEKLKVFEEEKFRNDLVIDRGVYKPLWRGNSVVNLAQTLNLNERRSQSEGRVTQRKKYLDSEKLLTHGIGSRIWSSLSMEQVNVLKNQLSEIYGKDSKFAKSNTIEVNLERDAPPSELKVRRNSDSSKSSPVLERKQMSEIDKKRISQSLSKEVLERQRKKSKVILGKETRGAIAAADAKVHQEMPSPRTCYSLEMSEDDQKKEGDFVLVLTKEDSDKHNVNETLEIWAQPKKPLVTTDATNKTSISETESGSTEGSIKTVIFTGSKEKIQDKVEYFENIQERDVYTPTIHKPCEEDEGDLGKNQRYYSQSFQDFKELFGEKELMKMTSEPLAATRKINYTPPPSPKLRSNYLYRSRSLSPYYEDSNVHKMKNRFEGFRWNSDPALQKIYIPGQRDVDSLRMKFEAKGRGRSRHRRAGVVSPIYLKDRFMPHINIISKIASLYPKKSQQQTRSSEELANILGIPIGEVEKLRQKFDTPEKMSLLGHMFTSNPNLNELRDIAQYLTGSWVAHKFPKVEDNTLPIKRPKSTSPVRPKTKLSSILKPSYQNGAPSSTSPKLEPVKFRSWWPPSPTHTRPTVKFKEPEIPPPPPPKGLYQFSDSSQESPRKYVENEVTIHYRTPVRQEVKEALSEDELAKRQADAMRKIYEEERRRKYLQVSHSDDELHDMNSRRHTDNFVPSQKSPIPLNRYDDFMEEMSPRIKPRPRSPEPRLVARALYNFVGQTSRELTFKKGDVIYIRRQVDKNWFEGELNAMIGLFPANYVEIIPYDGIISTPRKPHEGHARAKYNFIAQTHLELSLAKGELVVITRRVDDNWFEGKIGGRKGIFPVTYVEVLVDPSEAQNGGPPAKPVASPAAHSMLLNGSAGGKESMGSHNYVPTFPTQDLGMSYRAKPVQITGGGSSYGSLKKNPMDQALHIETQSDPIPYRALYKYKPQNEDELELLEGDTVYVLEKCDDGWYVGSSERTGAFGTFPGNYVERI